LKGAGTESVSSQQVDVFGQEGLEHDVEEFSEDP